MHRSGSVNRVWDDHAKYDSSSSKISPATRALSSLETDKDDTEFITSYSDDSPLSSDHATTPKREKGGRSMLTENAVHFIPSVLFLCAFILWFLSNPDIEVPMSGDAVAARIEGLTIEGDVDSSDGTQTGNLPLERTEIGMNTRSNNEDHTIN